MSSNSPLIKSCFFDDGFLYFIETFFRSNFLVGGNIINSPIISVANPGNIKRKDAKANAAPDIIS